jgi:hypothetical protein
MTPLDLESLATRLYEASEWLAEDIPAGTREIAALEGDVKLDELDLYCANLMQVASDVLGETARYAASETAGRQAAEARADKAEAERDEARRALEVWDRAFETGRTEPLYVARDHGRRTLNPIPDEDT